MLVNDGEMNVWSNTHFTIIDKHFTIISLKCTIIHSFNYHWEAAPTVFGYLKSAQVVSALLVLQIKQRQLKHFINICHTILVQQNFKIIYLLALAAVALVARLFARAAAASAAADLALDSIWKTKIRCKTLAHNLNF